MAGKVKISQEFMARVMAGTMTGPDAMKAELATREIAKAKRQRQTGADQVAACDTTIARLEGELKALLGEEPAE